MSSLKLTLLDAPAGFFVFAPVTALADLPATPTPPVTPTGTIGFVGVEG